jgi:hypothetical protein
MKWTTLPAGAMLGLAVFAGSAEAQEGKKCPTAIPVVSGFPTPCGDGSTGGVDLAAGATYAWQAFIAVNWPANAGQRGQPDAAQKFGASGATVWLTDRAKVEVYPGNASATVPPHGVALNNGVPVNGPDFGYGDKPEYFYSPSAVGTEDGRVRPCPGQPEVAQPAWVPVDETTEIGNNQTYAGVLSPVDPKGLNSKPRLIRYAVKMSSAVYGKVVTGQYWYNTGTPPLSVATANYTKALTAGESADPATPFVNFTPAAANDPTGYEVKSAWRPLTATELKSRRFFTSTVRYYEENPQGHACWREGTWGLVGMHLLTFTEAAPWGIWATFEQTDNILTAGGKPTEDADGKVIAQTNALPTSPALASNPDVPAPVVTKTGDYCRVPGARLFFRENPSFHTLPAAGDICVNTRWHPIPAGIIQTNAIAHASISSYSGAAGSPWLYYKLVNVQATPVDINQANNPRFSTPQSYSLANSVIETDYSLGNFTGNLVNGVPANLYASTTPAAPAVQNCHEGEYCNTALLPFQSNHLSFIATPLRMGGCAGCHAFAASVGQDFSFALGDNVTHPEAADAFKTATSFRNYKHR